MTILETLVTVLDKTETAMLPAITWASIGLLHADYLPLKDAALDLLAIASSHHNQSKSDLLDSVHALQELDSYHILAESTGLDFSMSFALSLACLLLPHGNSTAREPFRPRTVALLEQFISGDWLKLVDTWPLELLLIALDKEAEPTINARESCRTMEQGLLAGAFALSLMKLSDSTPIHQRDRISAFVAGILEQQPEACKLL
jgi:hypothetical protein